MKFIKTEGKTAQEVQDYIDRLVDEGATPYECVFNTNTVHDNYVDELDHKKYSYVGVDKDGDTFFNDDVINFLNDNNEVLNLLEIKEAAENLTELLCKPGVMDLDIFTKSLAKLSEVLK